jgi:fructose-specific phosphotransferase system IIC component
MERGLLMVLHSALITLVLYVFMVHVLKQNLNKAEDRSVLLGALILAYMVSFGHGLPNKINKNIM